MAKVIILGGGVAGLSAAHELLNRGFDVEIYERNPIYVGGKARSIDYNHEHQYKIPLPAEHGFRFFPGFYKHITATMREIPYPEPDSAQNVYENLNPTSRIMVARYGQTPIVLNASFPRTINDLKLIIRDLQGASSILTEEEEQFFAERVWQLISSCRERRDNDYERLSWWQFTQADRFSENYRHLLVEGLTRTLVAAKAETASTRTGGDIFLQLLFCMTDPAVNTDRVLDGPTNERWLHAWEQCLLTKNLKLTKGVSAIQVNMEGDRVKSITIDHQGAQSEITGDYYVLAMPVEKAALLINEEMIAIDERLQYIQKLAPSVAWMNGIQYYLNQDVPLNKGHIICSDSEWALTCISQVQFWDDYDITTRGNGQVKGVLSVDISDWFTPGKFTTHQPAHECLLEEVAHEVWAQLKASLNVEQEILRDDMLVDYYLDRDIRTKPSSQFTTEELTNLEPLLVNSVNTWSLRPEVHCAIPNLFFASDYVRTFTDLATMEGANEAARRAVNCILDRAGSNQTRCSIWNLQEPFCFAPARWWDSRRYRQGLPWSIRLPFPIMVLTVLLGFIYVGYALIKGFFVRR
jgi:uncharacterized protein with NAD-binding domain and iron-sulfur cluster